jgi:hypothetical protein
MNMHDPDIERRRVPEGHSLQDSEAVRGQRPVGRRSCADRSAPAVEEALRGLRPSPGHGLPARRRPAGLRRACSQQLGKNVGDDLREGKPTLPLLHRHGARQRARAQADRSAMPSSTVRCSVCRRSSPSSRPQAPSMPLALQPATRGRQGTRRAWQGLPRFGGSRGSARIMCSVSSSLFLKR